MWLPHRIMVEGLWLCPQHVTNEPGWQTYFLLCWSFRVPTAKEINLFLLAHVSSIFLFLACLPFPFHDPVSPFPNVSVHCALSPLHPHSLFPLSPPFLLFRRRAGSGVTNYAERAEKVVWVLPSGLPSWIIIREICRYSAATGCWHSRSLRPSTRLHRPSEVQTLLMPHWLSGSK